MKFIGIISNYDIFIDNSGRFYSIERNRNRDSEYLQIKLTCVEYKNTENNWLKLFNLLKNYTQDCVK